MNQPNPMLVQLTAADLREIVRSELADLLAAREAESTNPALLDSTGLAQALDVSTTHVRKITNEGCPTVMVGASRRYELPKVLAWLDSRKVSGEQ